MCGENIQMAIYFFKHLVGYFNTGKERTGMKMAELMDPLINLLIYSFNQQIHI